MLLVCTVLIQGAGVAFAQATPGNTAPGATSNTPTPGVSSSTGVTPGTGVVDRNTGAAAVSGDRNQAVATTGAHAAEPARGANSFSEGEARRRLESNGFQSVSGLAKDDGGVWRGTATKDGQTVQVWLDYKGKSGQQGGAGTVAMAGTANLDGTTGNPPGTAAGRAVDRTLGTNTMGANPVANAPDGTPGNPPGTAVVTRHRQDARHQPERQQRCNPTLAPHPAGNQCEPALQQRSIKRQEADHGHADIQPVV